MLSLRIHPEGWRFFALFAVAAFILTLIDENLGWIGFILSGWCLYFFRHPVRTTPLEDSFIISPADGVVHMVEPHAPPSELEMGDIPVTRISIFLNVFDVHVNRIPASGTITKAVYHKGQFLNASLDKASELNERQSLSLKTVTGHDIAFTQIAGLIARRIRCDVKEGDAVEAGSTFGLIRFGSRMDVFLPKDVHSMVVPGQRVIAGETVLADVTSKAKNREGRQS
jgi:phosphatidylserine decarboxylase